MLKLFVAKGTCSFASHIALQEAGIAYEAQRIDFTKGEQMAADFLAINPKGRVPALVTDRGVLTETPAILAYIAQSAPEAKLAPVDDSFAFGQIQAFNSYLCSTVHVAHAHGRRASRWADDQTAITAMQAKVAKNMGDCFALIEKDLFLGPWVMGQAYSICDPYLFAIAGWLESDGVDPADFPGVQDHMKRMEERPAVKAVHAWYEE
ncbi:MULTISPECIES: glutathione S-transferase family protein [Alphaproteobacteria]|uniref:Glutathione S-transferase n=2 Tax=Alphaproteobacteria TaxID=28211 RepID=A0A512HFQ5_9HYPH|nr:MULTISPECIES: glutathione S-transferase family protein [Alphaproteobacteria]GEO84283.1 glutathione S-transferase [Ciceribacter naphthalenivorans]GLR24819.1 glutathione S-transferase [Ciceribacter naphthalenivorans]GLT07675.1 glutathione S-transferase [Sphingomonas psychrolutea]